MSWLYSTLVSGGATEERAALLTELRIPTRGQKKTARSILRGRQAKSPTSCAASDTAAMCWQEKHIRPTSKRIKPARIMVRRTNTTSRDTSRGNRLPHRLECGAAHSEFQKIRTQRRLPSDLHGDRGCAHGLYLHEPALGRLCDGRLLPRQQHRHGNYGGRTEGRSGNRASTQWRLPYQRLDGRSGRTADCQRAD